MPVVPEEPADMDEFVNWDPAASPDNMVADLPLDRNASLLFDAVDGDDFSFWALEHYSQNHLAEAAQELGPDPGGAAAEDPPRVFQPVMAPRPCTHCGERGYECKTIAEGQYKGYCTSCVALRRECSFGLASGVPVPTANSFPPNPWPTLGDHPDPIRTDSLAVSPLVDLAAHQRSNSGGSSEAVVGLPPPGASGPPKLGTRFSRESVRVLKNWVSTHSRHPYPTEDEKEALQRLTGLNKIQIANWLANARRRGKIPVTRSTSPHVGSSWTGTGPLDIATRRSSTPSPFGRVQATTDHLPLQRWANSPPENEPASVTDIARAITSSASALSSGLASPYLTDDGSGRSLFNGSSASSAGTSQSSGGSFGSRGSFGSYGSYVLRGRRRRRRRSVPVSASSEGSSRRRPSLSSGPEPPPGGRLSLAHPLKTFQCTFCTETFKTKHDWQRHEKSLHLSLERWVCAPQGPVVVHPATQQASCVFCGAAEPDAAHVEGHNFAACQERPVGERTFYRKDHLRQHLRLVHDVPFAAWAMDPWRQATPAIRSRCGFCGIVMDSWSFRTDHLADHFKTGRTMADWKGDWGLDEPVLRMVENAIPPYLIHDERNTPMPFSALVAPPESPRNAFEILRMELAFWLRNEIDVGRPPDDATLLVEACRVVFAAEVTVMDGSGSGAGSGAGAGAGPGPRTPSWLYDLLVADPACRQTARLRPIRSAADSLLRALRVNGKRGIFDDCPFERALQAFVSQQAQLGLSPADAELQDEAARILRRADAELLREVAAQTAARPTRHDTILEAQVTGFLERRVRADAAWLAPFRARAHLPRSEDIADAFHRPAADTISIDATVHNNFRLEADLAEFVRQLQQAGRPFPDDAALQRQARIVIYGHEDGWNQTIADDPAWLRAFREKHTATGFLRPSPFFLNDTNCYRRLARELARFVAAAMSPHNPSCHVPTDDELQHQARWILYDDDDPWNQTAADNAEWLMRFKRDVGILPAGPGLAIETQAWNLCQGGTGFAPPYCFPGVPLAPVTPGDQPADDTRAVLQLEDPPCRVPHGLTSATNKYLQTFTTRFARPATVFCSRELEAGLAAFVRQQLLAGRPFPDDAALRAQARVILGEAAGDTTPADDDELLSKFKDMVRGQMGEAAQTEQIGQEGQGQAGQAGQTGLGGLAGQAGQAMQADQTEADIDQTDLSLFPLDLDLSGDLFQDSSLFSDFA